MRSIFEEKELKLSKDFELIGSDIHTQTAKKFLKELDNKVEELSLTYEQCREAAKLFKLGNFGGALKKIWKGKVKTESNHSDDGAVETYTYIVNGYAEFTEKIIRRNNSSYSHIITASYVNNPSPSYPLGTVIHVDIKANSYNFEDMQERSNKLAFLGRSTAAIYNILFVCFDGYDMSRVLSKYHLKIRNKIK